MSPAVLAIAGKMRTGTGFKNKFVGSYCLYEIHDKLTGSLFGRCHFAIKNEKVTDFDILHLSEKYNYCLFCLNCGRSTSN